jgi:hypothetical protein
MSGHFKKVCGLCDVIIAQCRCFSKERKLIISVCQDCKDKANASPADPHGVLTCDLKDGEFKNGRRG